MLTGAFSDGATAGSTRARVSSGKCCRFSRLRKAYDTPETTAYYAVAGRPTQHPQKRKYNEARYDARNGPNHSTADYLPVGRRQDHAVLSHAHWATVAIVDESLLSGCVEILYERNLYVTFKHNLLSHSHYLRSKEITMSKFCVAQKNGIPAVWQVDPDKMAGLLKRKNKAGYTVVCDAHSNTRTEALNKLREPTAIQRDH